MRSCRRAIYRQFPGALTRGVSQHDIEQLRVALYSTQKGLEEMADLADDPTWMRTLPDQIAWSITNTLHALAAALRDDVDAESRDDVARKAQVLRGHVHEALTGTAKAGDAALPPQTLLAALTMIGAAELVAESTSQARALATSTPDPAHVAEPGTIDPVAPAARSGPLPTGRTLAPTMALAIQAVVAAVAAGLIARAVGNEQSLVVAWTAFVIIAGSAGASTRRAWVRLPATILGAVAGVVIAASIPDSLFWTVAVVAVGVFFTIVTAPVSYPAMVFWMSIALVPLFATEGRYLDLIRDKAVAALIGACVAAVVALTIVPIRSSREVRPAVLQYLDALDKALESHLAGQQNRSAQTLSELDRAHAALDAIVASATTETNVFQQPESFLNQEALRIDAVHEAYLRLTPLLSDSSRRLHGWTDDRIETGIHLLRDSVEAAKEAARGETVDGSTPLDEQPQPVAACSETLELTDSLRRIENLHARLAELALLLNGHPRVRAAVHEPR